MSTGINIGELDRRIDLYNYTEAQSASGEPIKTWTLYKSAFARVTIQSGSESITADRPTVSLPVEFVIRWDSNVTEKTRIVFRSANYNIISIGEMGRKVWMQIIATQPDLQ